MAKMRAVDAAMYVLEKEGVNTAFGVPGAAINPFYSAMRKHGGIRHILRSVYQPWYQEGHEQSSDRGETGS